MRSLNGSHSSKHNNDRVAFREIEITRSAPRPQRKLTKRSDSFRVADRPESGQTSQYKRVYRY